VKKVVPNEIWEIVACPQCVGSLQQDVQGVVCKSCSQKFEYSDTGQLDLRLRKKKTVNLQFELGEYLSRCENFNFRPLDKNPNPEVDFSGIKVPAHLTEEIMSYMPRGRKDSFVLDLGCGDTVHKEICEYAGFEYVGLDYQSREATILGDAHALPFKDNIFDFVLSIAVLEHITYPFVMIKEVARTLKPGGTFIGTVSFLEPFHGNSVYHHTHLGAFNTLEYGNLDIQAISSRADWSVLKAQSRMILFPRMPHIVTDLVILPLYILHRIWWKIGQKIALSTSSNEERRLVSTSGSFVFIAHKNKSGRV
jgi:SAM-dependent methyltransferase